jgi:hypothetical protein
MAFLIGDVRVLINNVELGDQAFGIDVPFEKDQIDVSTFSPTGARSFLPGVADQTITISFRQNYASGKVHQTLYPLYQGGSTFPIYVWPDSDSGTSATNPVVGGTASIYSYNGLSGELNDSADIECEFKPAPGSSFRWGTAIPIP